MSEISVLMSVYKEPLEILKQSVESILNQTYNDFEFVIILDAPDCIENKEYLIDISETDDRIKLYINDKNLGLTASLNKGLTKISGKYVARMDADDVSYPSRLEKQLAYLIENDLDFIGGFVATIDDNDNLIQRVVKVPTKYSKICKMLKFNNCIFHPTWFLKKEIYDKIGGYGGKLVEDYIFVLDAMKCGYNLGNIPEVVLNYRMGQVSISRSNLYMQYLSMRYLQKKYFSHSVDNISIEKFLEKKFTNKKDENYKLSSNNLIYALSLIREKKVFKALFYILKAFFGSFDFSIKMVRYVFQYFV